jgi:Flp pilus assembly protein TadB
MTFYFAPVFKYIFLYVLICLLLIACFWTNMVGGNWLRRRRGRRSRTTDEAEQDEAQQAAQQDDLVQQQAAQQDDDDQQQDDDEAQQTASGSRSIYLRGPASLPQRPILWDRRPLIRPDGERHITLCSSFLFILCVQNHIIN